MALGKLLKEYREKKTLTLKSIAGKLGVSVQEVQWWEESGVSPDKAIIEKICSIFCISVDELMIKAGYLPDRFAQIWRNDPGQVLEFLEKQIHTHKVNEPDQCLAKELEPVFRTDLGSLYQADCLEFLPTIETHSVDCIFADPPFNLGKDYGKTVNDDLNEEEYLKWSYRWIDDAIRVLKPGGSFFLYNLPKWNIHLAGYLAEYLNFRHWITVDLKFSLPISGRLYPANYSLLYFVKGIKPRVFNPPRLPIQTCRHCGGELKDYGGYKGCMNPKGVNLTDVWTDIPPVRHRRYKNRTANELSLKMLDRVLDIATKESDLVLDPFGGSGTTYVACELRSRHWIGCEIGDCKPIIDRIQHPNTDKELLENARSRINILFTPESLTLRKRFGHKNGSYQMEEEHSREHQKMKMSIQEGLPF